MQAFWPAAQGNLSIIEAQGFVHEVQGALQRKEQTLDSAGLFEVKAARTRRAANVCVWAIGLLESVSAQSISILHQVT